MKKIILPLAAGMLLFASCKKDYTCTCDRTQTTTEAGTSTISTSSTETEVLDVQSKFVSDKMECYDEEYSYTYNNGVNDVTVMTEYDCEITK